MGTDRTQKRCLRDKKRTGEVVGHPPPGSGGCSECESLEGKRRIDARVKAGHEMLEKASRILQRVEVEKLEPGFADFEYAGVATREALRIYHRHLSGDGLSCDELTEYDVGRFMVRVSLSPLTLEELEQRLESREEICDRMVELVVDDVGLAEGPTLTAGLED